MKSQKSVSVWVLIFTYIRSFLGILFIIPYTAFCSITTMSAGLLNMQALATILIRGWGDVLLWVFGIRIEVKGEENLPKEGGAIAVFNHQSHFDIPAIVCSTQKMIRFGAKIELFKIPFFGRAMRAVGTLPIARENRSGVMKIYEEAIARFQQNTIFLLAPEGTRQTEPKIGRYKKGPFLFAINAGVPVVPVVIRGTFTVLPKNSLSINIGRVSRTVHIQYLPPVPTTGLKQENLQELVDRVRAMMVGAYELLPAD